AAATGTPLWSQTTLRGDNNGPDLANAVAVDPAGDVVVAGVTSNNGRGTDFTVLKLAGATGAPLWPAFVEIDGGGVDSDDDEAASVAVDPTGDVVASGTVLRRTGDMDMADFFVAKFAGADGAERWRHTVVGSVDQGATNEAFAVATDAGGNVVAGGGVENTGAGSDLVGVRLVAADGSEIARATAAGAGSASDDARAVAADAAGNVVGAGRVAGDITVVDVGCTGGEPHPCAASGPCYDAGACDIGANFCAE